MFDQLLNLSESERLLIADKLLESFTDECKEQRCSELTEDEDFQNELQRQLASMTDGTAELIDGEQVFREASERLRQRHQQ